METCVSITHALCTNLSYLPLTADSNMHNNIIVHMKQQFKQKREIKEHATPPQGTHRMKYV